MNVIIQLPDYVRSPRDVCYGAGDRDTDLSEIELLNRTETALVYIANKRSDQINTLKSSRSPSWQVYAAFLIGTLAAYIRWGVV